MALSSIGGLGAVALNNIDELADYSGGPIRAMTSRKDKERDQKLKEYEALIKRQEADAKTRNAATSARVQAYTELTAAQVASMHKSAPKLTGAPQSKERIPSYVALMDYYQNHGSAEGAAYADVLRKQYMDEYDLSPQDSGTQRGAANAASIYRDKGMGRQAHADANLKEAQRTQVVQDAGENDVEWAAGVVTGSDPNTKGWRMLLPNWSVGEVQMKKHELAAMLDQNRRMYPQLPEPQLRTMTVQAWKDQQGFGQQGNQSDQRERNGRRHIPYQK